jgi:hypothetical protein
MRPYGYYDTGVAACAHDDTWPRSDREGNGIYRVAGFVNERASSNCNHGASLANSYSARAHCSVISEIDTGLRNPRTCNQWVSF